MCQTGRKHCDQTLTADNGHMEILGVSLRRAESGGVGQTEIEIVRRIEADVGAGRQDCIADQGILIDAASDEKAPTVVTPFVLQITAVDVDALHHIVVIAQGDIMQIVMVVLHSGNEFGGHEPQTAERVGPLGA